MSQTPTRYRSINAKAPAAEFFIPFAPAVAIFIPFVDAIATQVGQRM